MGSLVAHRLKMLAEAIAVDPVGAVRADKLLPQFLNLGLFEALRGQRVHCLLEDGIADCLGAAIAVV